MISQRDTFIGDLFEIAKNDNDVILISVDMGAPTLDRWRSELPDQFIFAGISEQNAINFAAGLSAAGKKVYVYFMACWAARCFEQIRYSCAMANNPITIIGNGVGLGYAPAGPAHEPNEDIAYMRSILDIEIISPINTEVVKTLVNLTYKVPKLRYIRLERKYAQEFDDCYNLSPQNISFLDSGLYPVRLGLSDNHLSSMPKVALFSSGYMMGRLNNVWEKLINNNIEATLFDMWKIKPINTEVLNMSLEKYDFIVTIEEQTLSGGFGSAICEVILDHGHRKKVLRLGLPERYIFENGDRDYHLDNNGLSSDEIYNSIVEFLEK